MKRIVVLTTLFMLTLASVSLGQITLRGKVIDAKSGKAHRFFRAKAGLLSNNR